MNFLKSLLFVIIFLSNTEVLAISKKKAALPIERIQTNLVVNAETGKILHNVNGNEKIYPASLTKLMTLYMAFESIRDKRLSLDKQLPVSIKAQNIQPSKLGLRAGGTISTKDAIMATMVKSANDAAIVIAEELSGSEEEFAVEMTKKAHQLGMKNSHFYNSTGLPHIKQKSTAVDLAKLTMALIRDFPEFYSWFDNKDSFIYNGTTIFGHNKVNRHYEGAKGMKTGYTYLAGYNLITTASKNNKNLIGIVTGSPTPTHRNNKMVELLDHHFGTKTTFYDKPSTVLASTKKQTKSYAAVKKQKSYGKKLAKKPNLKKKVSKVNKRTIRT